MEESKFLNLNLKDFGKALILAIITAVLGFFYELIKAKGFDITFADFQQALQIAILAAISYLAKNLLTNSEDKFGQIEPKK